MDVQNKIEYWHVDVHGEYQYTPVTGKLLIRQAVGHGRGVDYCKLAPTEYNIPDDDDDSFAELMRFIYATTADSDVESDPKEDDDDDEEEEEQEAETEQEEDDSEQIEWESICDAFRWRDGKILLMTFGGGPSGWWATDATGNLWKWRQQWGTPLEFRLDLQPRTLLIRPATLFHIQDRCRPAPCDYAIPDQSDDYFFTPERFDHLPYWEEEEGQEEVEEEDVPEPRGRRHRTLFNLLQRQSLTLRQLFWYMAGFDLDVMYWHRADVGYEDDAESDEIDANSLDRHLNEG